MEVDGDVYVFWKYDLFPYCSGGIATKMKQDGRHYVPSIQGWVTPIAVRSGAHGKNILDDLKTLERAHTKAKAALLQDYRVAALQVAPFLAKEKEYAGT